MSLRSRLARLSRLSRASVNSDLRPEAELAEAEFRRHSIAALRAVGGGCPAPDPLSPAAVAWLSRQPEVSREEAIAALRSLTCRRGGPEWDSETTGGMTDG